MVTQLSKQLSKKTFLKNKLAKPTSNQEMLNRELEDIIYYSKPSDDKENQIDSDHQAIARLQNFFKKNKQDPDLKFVLNLKKGKSKSTVLHDFASVDGVEVIDLLLKAGANTNIKNGKGKTALQVAIDSYSTNCIGLFLSGTEKRLSNKQKELNDELLNLLSTVSYSSTREKCDSEYDINSGNFVDLKRFIDYHRRKNSEDLKVVLNLQRGEFGSTVLHDINNLFYTETFNLLLSAGGDPNIQDKDGKTPLHSAAEYNCIEIAKSLLDSNKVNVNIQDKDGKTPLHHASEQGYEDIVAKLLNCGAKVDIQDYEGNTALHNAAREGHKNIIEPLIEKIKNINCQNLLKETALHLALWCSKEPMLADSILDKYNGEGIDNADYLGRTPLLLAAEKSEISVLEKILARGANIKYRDKDGNTVLHYAARNEYTGENGKVTKYDVRTADNDAYGLEDSKDYIEDTAKRNANLLIYKGADINAVNKYKQTPLFSAIDRNNNETADLLLSKGANINISDENGFTALHFAIKNNNLEIFKNLLPKVARKDEYGFPIVSDNGREIMEVDIEKSKKLFRAVDKNGNTFLHHAAKWYCSEEILNLLIQYSDIDINARNRHGIAPIHIAAKYGNLNQIKFCIKKKADLNILFSELSQLIIDEIGSEKRLSGNDYINDRNGNVDISSTVKIDKQTSHKRTTALLIAIYYGNPDVVEMLIDGGAAINISDGKSLSSLDVAIKQACDCKVTEKENRYKVVKILAPLYEEKTIYDAMVHSNVEIKKILQDAVEASGDKKSPKVSISVPMAPTLDDSFYSEVDVNIITPTIYPDLSNELNEFNTSSTCNESKWGKEGPAAENTGAEYWSGSQDFWSVGEGNKINSRQSQKENCILSEWNNGWYKNENSLSDNKQASSKRSEEKKGGNLISKSWPNGLLELVSKVDDIKKLFKIVDEALKLGVRINFAQDNQKTFTHAIISRMDYLNVEKDEDVKVASQIICNLALKGGHIDDCYDPWALWRIWERYEEDIEGAKRKFKEYYNQFRCIAAESIRKGRLQHCEIDNTYFYLKYSSDSVVNVAKVIDGVRSLKLHSGNMEFAGNIVKIGESEVEIKEQNGTRNYTDLSDNDSITLTFCTSLGELNVDLIQSEDRITVNVTDEKKFHQLQNISEEIGKNCLLGGYSVYEAIKRGYFERSGKLQFSEVITSKVRKDIKKIMKDFKRGDIVNSSLNDVSLLNTPIRKGKATIHKV